MYSQAKTTGHAHHNQHRTISNQITPEAGIDDPARSVNVKRRENVIQDNYLGFRIDSSSQRYASLQIYQYLTSMIRRIDKDLLATTEKRTKLVISAT